MSATVHWLLWPEDSAFEGFTRNADRSWTCHSHTVVDHPSGRIEVWPGTTFLRGALHMNVDLAAWLDEEMARAKKDGLGAARGKQGWRSVS